MVFAAQTMKRTILLLSCLLAPLAARADNFNFEALVDRFKSAVGIQADTYKVINIADGDTLTLLKGKEKVKVRLGGIDAPERKQAFGNRSRESLEELCAGKQASYQTQDTDRYGRVVAQVTCAGIDANRAQVERGMAWVYVKYNKDTALPVLEAQARAKRRGLWADARPVAPWNWRQENRETR